MRQTATLCKEPSRGISSIRNMALGTGILRTYSWTLSTSWNKQRFVSGQTDPGTIQRRKARKGIKTQKRIPCQRTSTLDWQILGEMARTTRWLTCSLDWAQIAAEDMEKEGVSRRCGVWACWRSRLTKVAGVQTSIVGNRGWGWGWDPGSAVARPLRTTEVRRRDKHLICEIRRPGDLVEATSGDCDNLLKI